MSELTIQEMQEKIERVEKDIAGFTAQGESGRRLEVLIEYKNYLKDELDMMKQEQRLAK